MDKKLSEIFKYNVKNSSEQLLNFIEDAKTQNWKIEDLIFNVEWVANEMQKQYENNYNKFIKMESNIEHMNELIHSSLSKLTDAIDHEDDNDDSDWLNLFLTTKI